MVDALLGAHDRAVKVVLRNEQNVAGIEPDRVPERWKEVHRPALDDQQAVVIMHVGRGALSERLDEFDALLLGQLRNDMLAELLDRLQAHLRRIGAAGARTDRFAASVEAHRAVLNAITTHDAASAQHLIRRHLQHVLSDRLDAMETSPS